RLFGFARLDQLLVEILHPSFLAANIERSVTTDREEPGRGLRVLESAVVLKFHESLLYHITRPFAVAGDSRRELQERKLKSPQQHLHPFRVRLTVRHLVTSLTR